MSFKSNFSIVKPDICRRCSKTVYCAEKIIGAGEVFFQLKLTFVKIWHKACFRCRNCGRSLEPGKYCDREKEIYCNSRFFFLEILIDFIA